MRTNRPGQLIVLAAAIAVGTTAARTLHGADAPHQNPADAAGVPVAPTQAPPADALPPPAPDARPPAEAAAPPAAEAQPPAEPDPADPEAAAEEALQKRIAALIDEMKKASPWRETGPVAKELGRIGARAVPALTAVLGDGDPDIRSRAALVLGRIGPAAKDAVPSLIAVLRNKGGPVAEDEAALKKALADLGAVDFQTRRQAARVLKEAAGAALHLLEQGAKSDDPEVSVTCRQLLAEYQSVATDPVRRKRLAAVRQSAVDALGRIGAGAEDAVPEIVAALRDENPEVRREAA